jgi:hypothetical protein
MWARVYQGEEISTSERSEKVEKKMKTLLWVGIIFWVGLLALGRAKRDPVPTDSSDQCTPQDYLSQLANNFITNSLKLIAEPFVSHARVFLHAPDKAQIPAALSKEWQQVIQRYKSPPQICEHVDMTSVLDVLAIYGRFIAGVPMVPSSLVSNTTNLVVAGMDICTQSIPFAEMKARNTSQTPYCLFVSFYMHCAVLNAPWLLPYLVAWCVVSLTGLVLLICTFCLKE